MAELQARGPGPEDRWRHPLPEGSVTLGRTDRSAWQVPWDRQVSGLHASLQWADGLLRVRRLPTGRNQIFYQGTPLDEFSVPPGGQFVIGATTFQVLEALTPSAPDLPTPHTEYTCSAEELRSHHYVDADERIEVLSALPGVIRLSPSDAELQARVVDVLLRGTPRAEAAAVVRVDEGEAVSVGEVGRRGPDGEFRPSRRLVLEAIRGRRQSVLHVWQAGALRQEFTVAPGSDWALCSPLPDDPLPGWGLYLTGRLPAPAPGGPGRDDLLKSDLKFAELVADVFGSLRQVSFLQRRQGQLSRFLSRPVLAALVGRDMDEVLKPRQAQVTVLFCDLRGSCRLAEEGSEDLAALWDRVSAALALMSGSILDQDGVIGDFQGDAAMGFWGWPLEAADGVERAARAALAIRRRFAAAASSAGHPLAGFACGIGIAHGTAIAGRLGTPDQFKIDVFGPVVNLAARLESMTKRFGAGVLLDEECGRRLASPANAHWARARRLARVRPYGMSSALTVSELLPPAVEGPPAERDRLDYEAALGAFMAGRWDDARKLLARLPRDGAATFLQEHMARNPAGPPADWDGTLALDAK
jgi:adenylate cyclase